MSVRNFNGTSDVITLTGPGTAIFNAAFTYVQITKTPSLDDTNTHYIGWRNSGTYLAGFADAVTSTGKFGIFTLTTSTDSGAGVTIAANTWYIMAVTWTGSGTPTFHSKPLGSGSWQQNTGVGDAFTANATTCNLIYVGAHSTSAGYKNMRIGTAAFIAGTALSNANVQTIQTTPSTQQLADLGATNLWDFNQASTATAVEDLIGSADQSAISGTTVVGGDDPPGWTFGLAGAPEWPPADTPPGPALRVVRSNLRLG